MSEKEQMRREVLEQELETVSLLRRRAKDDPLRSIVAAEREMEIKEEILKLEGLPV